ncbi:MULTISPECIES: ABC transporter ATP-binding protein [Clostridium]|uniref:Putative siderophore transport system ATP-binding protein YusV n=2 Tax=Clostridium TaxID=1485 RepID=A0A151AL96_9CLOT|nr:MULTISPECIES: ABC transporter ATP-binding protein [Clostridium]KYH28157.1 putative siderophore transport system ATP-binding protein YusV [Clostridium colicanis DSM 13634]PRR72701.1 putative siderophore transport system ATP-binding protein YusV [Clostridium thermopalmarium DSM 5974]PVZ20885.1 iron complex transport system ATP-binding protein [Clostridium thermopalmarium DSM 5974]
MIELKNLSAGYNGVDIIRNVSLKLDAGDNLCILGVNGSGKTTLLKAIAGIIPSQGDVLIDGKSIKAMKRQEIANEIAVMSQLSNIYFSYTVFETVLLGRYLYMKNNFLKEPSEKDKAYVRKCLETVGMLDKQDKQIDTLSGGQLQRVFLARALAQEPNIILLDEPTNHLDLKSQRELIYYLKRWSKDYNHSVIGVFHDINHALELADYLLVLAKDNVMVFGKPEEIINSKLLDEVYEMDVAGYMIDCLKKWER